MLIVTNKERQATTMENENKTNDTVLVNGIPHDKQSYETLAKV